MSSRQPLVRATVLVLACVVAASCSKKSTPSTPTPPAAHAAIAVTSVNVSGERGATGFVYRVVVRVRESGGVAATISAVDLTFSSGTAAVKTEHFDQTIPASGNSCAANAACETRELVTTDADAAHAYATRVLARVSYRDASSSSDSTAEGSADVPALPAPSTFTLTGFITDRDTNGGIDGARVEAINGANAGKATTTNSAGAYSLAGLVGETFRMRASAGGYESGEQNVTVPDITRADLQLHRPSSAACAYSVAPTGTLDVPTPGNTFALTITRTSGSCGWQASTDVTWISLGSTSGSGSGSLSFSYTPNALFVPRTGTVTISWTGGSASITVRQAGESPAFCRIVSITVGGQNPLNIGAGASATITAQIVPEAGTPPGACGTWNATGTSGVTFTSATTGPTVPATISFTVSANPSTSIRTLFVVINFVAGNPSASLTINQSGS
jgi:hypothetical protein